jgi:hypothetical protein
MKEARGLFQKMDDILARIENLKIRGGNAEQREK